MSMEYRLTVLSCQYRKVWKRTGPSNRLRNRTERIPPIGFQETAFVYAGFLSLSS